MAFLMMWQGRGKTPDAGCRMRSIQRRQSAPEMRSRYTMELQIGSG